MEDMFSLGNVGLWKYVTNSSWAPTGDTSFIHYLVRLQIYIPYYL